MLFDHLSGKNGRTSSHVGTSFVVLPRSSIHCCLAESKIRRLLTQGWADDEERALMKFGMPTAKTTAAIAAKIIMNVLDIRVNDA